MSAYSIPSPVLRATSLPVKALVSSGERIVLSDSGLGYAFRGRRRSNPLLPEHDADGIVDARVDLADVVDPPGRAPESDGNRLRLPCHEPQDGGLGPVSGLHALGKLEPQLEAVDRRPRPRDDRRLDLLALQPAVPFERQVDLEPWVPRDHRAEREEERERGRDDRELRASQREGCDERHRSDDGVALETRAASPSHRAAATSSADGVGTPASTSRTTSSTEIRCTQSSGRRTSRCASAGTPIAFTSSGST